MSPQMTPQQIQELQQISATVSSLSTKIRINEQNILNLQSRVQLLSRNFLDLKKEMRGKTDIAVEKSNYAEKKIKEIMKKLEKFEKEGFVSSGKDDKKEPDISKPKMTAEEAENILDDILEETKDE